MHIKQGSHDVSEGDTVSLRCHVEVVDHASPPEIEWLRHVAVNGSLHDDDGAANLRTLQSCRMDGVCQDGHAATFYREVQGDFTPEMEIFNMLFERCHTV